MSVSDHGLEAIRKATEQLESGDNREFAIRVKDYSEISLNDSIEIKITELSTTRKIISTPDNTGNFYFIHHNESSSVYIGDDSLTSLNGLPLKNNVKLDFSNMYTEDGNNIWGITSDGTALIYSVGVYES